MAKILEGKSVRETFADKLKSDIAQLPTKPTMVIFQVGSREDSNAFIRQKKLFAESIGAKVIHEQYDEDVMQNALLKKIEQANKDSLIHGIILQLPLPKHLDKQVLIEAINYKKDVDGLTSKNLKLLFENDSAGLIPAASKGIITLLDAYDIPIAGKKVVIVGRSTLVGKPTMLALLNRNATVSICHDKTENLKEETKTADILILAIGDPEFITASYINPKKQQAIIDVGINKKDGKTVGDVDFASVEPLVSAISPVPGGVGPMTVLSLFQNLVEAYKRISG